MSVGRLERVLYGSIGVVLFVIAAAMRRGHTIAVTSRIIVHVGGRSASVSVALALAIPMAVLVIALARTAAVRDALRALCRTPADVALIVAALALLLVTLIPAADSGRAMVVFLAYATTGFVLALWSLWPVVFGASEHWVAATIAVLREVPSGAFVIAVFLVVFLPANLISYGVFEHIPHVQDSISQLFQATLFAHGRAWLPTPPFGEFFDYTHVVMAPRWYSQFPPGHAAVLTLGVWLHAPWLINPLLGGATVVAVYHLGREVYGESVARVAAVLAALSPFIVFMSSEYMNHGSALLCVTLFMLGFARTLRTARWGWAALAGLGLGGVVCIRPLTGLALALPFVAYALYRAGREPQRLLLPFTLLALTSAVPLSGFLVYNQRTTGSPWTLGYEAKHGAGHGLGFGHSGWGPPHTPRRGVIHTLNNLNGMERYLFEWPIPSLLFVVVLVWSRRWRTWDALLLASWLSLVIAYFFYWYQDLCFGPRFQFEGAAALVLLTARGLQCLPHLLRTRCRMAVSRERVLHATGLIVGLCLVSMATVSLPPLMALYASSYWRVNGDVYRGVRRNQVHGALVFVDSNYGGAFLGNFRDSLDLNGDLVYARNLAGAGVLLAAYPGRRYYVADGANLTEIHRPEDLVPGQMRRWNDAWRLSQCGDAVAPGLLREFGGKRIVWRTYPVDGERPCVLTTTVQASSKKQSLDLCVAADAGADSGWGLRVYANDELIEQRVVSSEGGRLRWQPVHCEITAAAPATIRLEHRADGRSQATGYWAYARLTAATEAKPVECTAPESAIEVDAPD